MSAGIIYPLSFLDSLPVLSPRKLPYPPIRAIDHSQFAQLHAKHLFQFGNNALDSILFPYLHGVEHGSQIMRDYFCGPSHGMQTGVGDREGIGVAADGKNLTISEKAAGKAPARAPDYRGLIWVACDGAGDDEDDPTIGINGTHMYLDDGLDEEMLVDDDELNIRRPSDASTSSLDSAYSLLRTSTSNHSPSTSTSASSTDVASLSDDITMSDSDQTITPTPIPKPVIIPCSFKASDILSPSRAELLPPKVPELVSLRNFGIQVSAYARISDIVVYSPNYRGVTRSLLELANRLAAAHEALYEERSLGSLEPHTPLHYNIFILTSHPSLLPPNQLSFIPNFPRMETLEMQTLTRSSEVLPGIFLGNSADVPIWSSNEANVNVFDNSNNPFGYDLVVECMEGSSTAVPNPSHLKRAEDHLTTLQSLWATGFMLSAPPARPAPNAHSILHLPFPGSPSFQTPLSHIISFVSFLQNLLHPQRNTRRSKVLIYSTDGYTESSVLALALIMAEKKCTLPDAYLELQVKRGRSFFVHQNDLATLKMIESKYSASSLGSLGRSTLGKSKERGERDRGGWPFGGFGKSNTAPANSDPPLAVNASSLASKFGRRSNSNSGTPNSPISSDNATWFNHPKFDGSFPSRVLPFLYLGNLDHAVNAYMLHALGITHVVSVGECAILPPDEPQALGPTSKPHGYGSLWLEEREGRIKVMDIKNMSDDGMDSLLPQLDSICDWIERARQGGGKVLVHCRVGVSRSATVTIAYLMKYLQLPLVDSYLIVRSRRLCVLIQPNMRLLFNLLGWEVRIARERTAKRNKPSADVAMIEKKNQSNPLVSDEEEAVAKNLSRALSWPFLCREVHRLNAKYIR